MCNSVSCVSQDNKANKKKHFLETKLDITTQDLMNK